jgi:SRSO17 transposase
MSFLANYATKEEVAAAGSMLALRLFLPESWTNDRVRLERAGVPVEYCMARTRPEIALAEIDRMIADTPSIAVEDMLTDAKWQNISWRAGTKGKLEARFAAVRVRTADGPVQRIGDQSQQHLPGDEAWLVGEHRKSGERKYYLANLPARTNLRTLAATIKARWICEQAHQQLKEELVSTTSKGDLGKAFTVMHS